MAIAKPRITDGSAYTWAGGGLLAFAMLLGVFAAADAPGAAVLAGTFALAGSSCLFVGFWKRLFHNIELRLIDVQAALTPSEPAPAVAADPGPQA